MLIQLHFYILPERKSGGAIFRFVTIADKPPTHIIFLGDSSEKYWY